MIRLLSKLCFAMIIGIPIMLFWIFCLDYTPTQFEVFLLICILGVDHDVTNQENQDKEKSND